MLALNLRYAGWSDEMSIRGACVIIGICGICSCSPNDAPEAADAAEAAPEAVPWLALDTVSVLHSDDFYRLQSLSYDGTSVFALNAGSLEALVIDASTGAFTARLGGLGRGPGEFQAVTAGVMRGDSILVVDGLIRRAQLFVAGEYENGWNLAAAGPPSGAYIRGDGAIVVTINSRVPNRPSTEFDRVLNDSVLFMVTGETSSESEWRNLFTAPSVEYFRQSSGGMVSIQLPWFVSGGSHAVFDGGVVLADGRAGTIAVRTWDGRTRTLLQPPQELPPITEAEIEAGLARLRARSGRPTVAPGQVDQAQPGLAVWNGPPPRPYYRLNALLTDGATIAVQEWAPGVEQADWLFMNMDADLIGRLSLPAETRLVSISGVHLAAISRDSLDAESILLLRSRFPN